MEITTLTKVLTRLPNLITLLFSLTLVSGFRLLNDRYHWNSDPTFSLSNWNDVLVLLSFMTTLLFIVTAWLGFSVLIERVPYKTINRFLFDTLRFSALFPLLMWCFLVEKPLSFQVYVWGLSGWHLLMTIWYLWPMLFSNTNRTGHTADLSSHGIISAVYFSLGLAYYLLVAKNWATQPNEGMRIAMVLLILAVIAFWSINRLISLQKRLIIEATPKELVN